MFAGSYPLASALTGATVVGPDGNGAIKRFFLPPVIDVRQFGAVGDGVAEGEDAAINDAIEYASRVGGEGAVFIPGGTYQLNGPVQPLGGVNIIGAGAGLAASSVGTTLVPASGYTGDGILFDDVSLWHNASLQNMQVRGFNGYGVRFLQGTGENSFIDRVAALFNGADGIEICGRTSHGAITSGGGTPTLIGQIQVANNGGAGLRLDSLGGTHTQIGYIAGDDNAESLCTIENLGASACIRILGWKSERNDVAGHPIVFKIDDCNGGVIDLGMGRVSSSVAASTEAVIKSITSASYLEFLFTYAGTANGYAYDFNDTNRSETIAFGDAQRYRFRTIPEWNFANAWGNDAIRYGVSGRIIP